MRGGVAWGEGWGGGGGGDGGEGREGGVDTQGAESRQSGNRTSSGILSLMKSIISNTIDTPHSSKLSSRKNLLFFES